jgi:hypothetical protein
MRKHRPIARASAPEQPPSNWTKDQALLASTIALANAPNNGAKTAQRSDAPSQSSIQQAHPSLTALARLLGRKLAREASEPEGRDD